jgi:7-cyano-7-deazaguanine synthase in queuosine biosynthesis
MEQNNSIAAKALIGDALELVRYQDMVHVLHILTREFENLRRCSKKGTLLHLIQESGIKIPLTLSLFNTADLIWQTIYKRYPEVYIYPLGEINERSLKSTIGELITTHPSGLHKLYTGKSLIKLLETFFSDVDCDEIITIFLTNWCFNLAITNLRSTDLGFAYHFSPRGKYRAFAEHLLVRKALYSTCQNISIEMSPFLSSKSIPEFDEALEKVFGLKRAKKSSRTQFKKPYLNVVVGTTPKSRLNSIFNISNPLTRIILHDKKKRNVDFEYSAIESCIKHNVSTLVKDLIEIGFAVYIADIFVKRQPNLERRLSILVPVRHLEKWTPAKKQLEHVISLLGRDQVDIHFTKHGEDPDGTSYDHLTDSNKCCCLLSGGLDSAIGAMWTLQKSLAPILISHTPSKLLSDIQTCVVDSIEQEFGQHLHHIPVPWKKSGKRKGRYKLGVPPESPMLQHLRSFFYFCLATGIALDKGYKKVYIFENGPVAINPILSEAHINTKTVHPIFLQEFNSLIRTVFGAEIQLENPFLYKTKGETLKVVENRATAFKILPKTNSCLHYWRVPVEAGKLGIENCSIRHDGVCLPCMLRRVAMNSADIPESANYLTDIFDLFGSDMAVLLPERIPDILVDMADLVRFCQYIIKHNDGEILCTFPDLSVSAEGVNSRRLLAMMKRHSKEVTKVFKKELKLGTRTIFYSALR